MKDRYTAQEMREMALVEESYGRDVVAKMLRQAADDLERESTSEKSSQVGNEEAKIMRVSVRTQETNFDRFAFLPEMEHGAQISTAFSFYLEEQYPPKLRGAVCMDRAYYDFLLWLFSAPGKNGVTK